MRTAEGFVKLDEQDVADALFTLTQVHGAELPPGTLMFDANRYFWVPEDPTLSEVTVEKQRVAVDALARLNQEMGFE